MPLRHDRLREVRAQRDMSQDDIAAAVGIGARQYRRYEAGESEPTADVLGKIADAYQVNVDYLLGRSNDPSPYAQLSSREVMEARLAAIFAELNSEQRETLISYARFLKENRVREST